MSRRRTARIVAKNSHVNEYDLSAVTGQEHVQALAERMSSYSRDLKDAALTAARLGDLATEDIFVEQLRALDMDTWFLDASQRPQPKAKREAAEEIQSGAVAPLRCTVDGSVSVLTARG